MVRGLVVGATNNSYNADGTLVAQTQSSITTRYTQDLAAPLSQILADGTQRYVYGNPAELFRGRGSGIRDQNPSNSDECSAAWPPTPDP